MAASLATESIRFSLDGHNGSRKSITASRLDHRNRDRDLARTLGPEGTSAVPAEVRGNKAVAVIQRVQDKLSGRDFGNADPYDVSEQVDRLICQATSIENLCQLFTGWCSFW